MNEALDPGKEARTASGIPVVAAFDGYRAVAIILVTLYHVALFSGTLVAAGSSTVAVILYGGTAQLPLTMLFIISGFVLFLPTVARDGSFGRVSSFAIRRFARILPAYWLALLVSALVLVAIPAAGGLPSISTVVLHVTMLQSPATLFGENFQLGFGVIPAVWTLSTETAFYLLLPLVAVRYFRRPWLGLLCAAGVLLLWREAAINIGDIGDTLGFEVSSAAQARFDSFYASQFPSWGLAIAAGMTGAWAFVRLRERVEPKLLERRATIVALIATLATAGVVAAAGIEATHDPDVLTGLFARQTPLVALLFPLVLATAMVAVAMSPRRIQAPFALGPMRAMGDISYSVYLIHLAVLLVLAREVDLPVGGSLGAFLAWASITLVASFAYAYCSSTLLERPVRRWARRISSRPQAAGEVLATPDPAHSRSAEIAAPAARAPGDETPAVSIVIPTYNREKWLADALDSVLAQDYPNLEALVVNDGSSDGTAELLRGYESRLPRERFRFISQENAGQATALNRGNAEARGEILGYLSDDDALLPGAVSRLATELIADSGVAIAYPGYREIDEDGEITDTVRPVEYDSLNALRLHDTVIGPGALARRDAIEAAGGWDPELRWLGDLVLWIKTGISGRAVRVPEPLALWRRHDGSATVALSAEHSREHLRCAALGLELDGLRASRTDEAEAIRNACVFAALFAGDNAWPRDRFIAIDMHRRLTSAIGSKLGPDGEIDWEEVERAGRLYRELARIVFPAASAAGQGGVKRARKLLREAGIIAGSGGEFEIPSGAVSPALIEAAFACGADVKLDSTRFMICDLELAQVDPADLAELGRLGFFSSAAELEAAIERRRNRR